MPWILYERECDAPSILLPYKLAFVTLFLNAQVRMVGHEKLQQLGERRSTRGCIARLRHSRPSQEPLGRYISLLFISWWNTVTIPMETYQYAKPKSYCINDQTPSIHYVV